jgi:CxxC motif-containing protein (DUF1111 family)
MRRVLWSMVAAALVTVCGESATGEDFASPPRSPGERLFTHNFGLPSPETDNPQRKGDGLGPVFNDFSCVACHRDGGAGGSGPLEKNIRVINLVLPDQLDTAERERALREAAQLHPAFASQLGTVPLHHFGMPADGDPHAYESFLVGLLDQFGVDGTSPRPVRKTIGKTTYEIAERNTSALWGLGLIEEFRQKGGDDIRRRLMEEQNRKHRWVSGRVPRDGAQRESWFGWRGHSRSLHEFNLGACSNELGLSVPGVPQPENPLLTPGLRRVQRENEELDLSDEECRALTQFVAGLPRPRQFIPTDEAAATRIREGEAIFERCQCNVCHVRDLGWIQGLYSDMLLHDLGDRLCDHMQAVAEILPGQIIPAGPEGALIGGYYPVKPLGNIATPPKVLPTECGCEWRTTPLWGVADSAPYLHDGRAPTLHDAILWHDGEAKDSRLAYQTLSDGEQIKLLEFLMSLRAPVPESPRRTTPPQLATHSVTLPERGPVPEPALPMGPAVAARVNAAPPQARPAAEPAAARQAMPLSLSPQSVAALSELLASGSDAAAKLAAKRSYQRLVSNQVEPALADYAYGLVLKRDLDHFGAMRQFELAAREAGPFAWRARQLLVREQFRTRKFDEALIDLQDLAAAAAAGDLAVDRPQREDCVRWIAAILAFLQGPAGLTDVAAKAQARSEEIERGLPEPLRASFAAGVADVEQTRQQLLAERTQAVAAHGHAREQKDKELASKEFDLQQQRDGAALTRDEWKTWLARETRKVDVRLEELDKQCDTAEKVESHLLVSILELNNALRVVQSRRKPADRPTAAEEGLNAQLELLSLRRTQNNAELQTLLREAAALTENRLAIVQRYRQATGETAQQLTTLSKWNDRLSKQKAFNAAAVAEDSPEVRAIDRRLRALATYDPFSIEAEIAALLARLPGEAALAASVRED